MFDIFYTGPKPNVAAHEQPSPTFVSAAQEARTKCFWFIDGSNDYSDFDFHWYPRHDKEEYVSTFRSNWQRDSGTYFSKTDDAANRQTDYVDEEPVVRSSAAPVHCISFNNKPNKGETRFNDSYLETLKRIVRKTEHEYIWVVTDICDYTDFDFSWKPEQEQDYMLHVFSDGKNKFGDTFYINVETFKKQMRHIELLEWFGDVNFCTDQIVPRKPIEEVRYKSDDLPKEILKHNFQSPYALFLPASYNLGEIDYTPSVWRQKDRAIHTFTESSSVVMCPRDAKQFIKAQCYDYPHILKHQDQFLDETPLNIVFISNGEENAEQLYDHLLDCTIMDNALTVKRVDRIDGRAEAYREAALISETDWFLAVFAKLEVNEDFDWHWQPDRLQEPKHYIFHAKNPINMLEYGHQAMIAYNKHLVLDTQDPGLDFTLSKPHEVVPILSGIAVGDTDAYSTWRTAFREVIKLIVELHENESEETYKRLMAWSKGCNGEFGWASVQGAADAHQFYGECAGNMEHLQKSFEWKWLQEYYASNSWNNYTNT